MKIIFGRYIPTLTIYTDNNGNLFNVFESSIDHVANDVEELVTAFEYVDKWLQDHFGYALIFNGTEYAQPIKLTNRHKMVSWMAANGIRVKLQSEVQS